MELDRIIHEKKNFAELDDADIEAFLRKRSFNTEHLHLEFKRDFPRREGGRFRIGEICGYIAAFCNAEGGIIVYGVGDEIKDPAVTFPAYVYGVPNPPSREDLSEWAKNYISPLIQSPAIREFSVASKTIIVLKIPVGRDLPYLVCPPGSSSFSVPMKTAGGIAELKPSEIKDFYRRRIIEEAYSVAKLAGGVEAASGSRLPAWITGRKEHNMAKLEAAKEYGYVGIYCRPIDRDITIPIAEIEAFFQAHRADFSEVLRLHHGLEPGQDYVSVGYYPTAVRSDIKSTSRITLYTDGTTAFDSQIDFLMDRQAKSVNPYSLCYEIQRHLQLTKAFLTQYNVDRVIAVVDFEFVNEHSMVFSSRFDREESPYTGKHAPIFRNILLRDVNDHDRSAGRRNIVMPVVKDIMDEISRIFGFSRTLPGVWEDDDYLHYVKGLESLR